MPGEAGGSGRRDTAGIPRDGKRPLSCGEAAGWLPFAGLPFGETGETASPAEIQPQELFSVGQRPFPAQNGAVAEAGQGFGQSPLLHLTVDGVQPVGHVQVRGAGNPAPGQVQLDGAGDNLRLRLADGLPETLTAHIFHKQVGDDEPGPGKEGMSSGSRARMSSNVPASSGKRAAAA